MYMHKGKRAKRVETAAPLHLYMYTHVHIYIYTYIHMDIYIQGKKGKKGGKSRPSTKGSAK